VAVVEVEAGQLGATAVDEVAEHVEGTSHKVY